MLVPDIKQIQTEVGLCPRSLASLFHNAQSWPLANDCILEAKGTPPESGPRQRGVSTSFLYIRPSSRRVEWLKQESFVPLTWQGPNRVPWRECASSGCPCVPMGVLTRLPALLLPARGHLSACQETTLSGETQAIVLAANLLWDLRLDLLAYLSKSNNSSSPPSFSWLIRGSGERKVCGTDGVLHLWEIVSHGG